MKSIFAIAFLIFTAIINVSSASQLEFKCNGPAIPCGQAIDDLGKPSGFLFRFQGVPPQGFITSPRPCKQIADFFYSPAVRGAANCRSCNMVTCLGQ